MGAQGVPILGGIFGAGGALMEADDKSRQMKDEAFALEQNAKIALEAGAYNAERLMVNAGKQIGAMQSDYAASGITSDSGSVLDVLRESHANAELDRMNILYGAEMKSLDLMGQASAARRAGKRAKQMGNFNAFASLFGGAAKSASYDSSGTSSSSSASDYGSAGGSGLDTGSFA